MPFLIFVAVGTLIAVVLGTIGRLLIERRERPEDPSHLRPDPERAWTTIRTECVRRVKADVKRDRVERVVRAFIDEIAEYRRATGLDPGPARQYLAETIARELTVERKPAVRAALVHAHSLLLGDA
jgi:hypothetical protein